MNELFVKKAFRIFLVSCILSSLGTSIGSFVDAIIVGNAIGQDALAVINIAMPLYMLYNTIGFTIGSAAITSISAAIGQMDKRRANEIFSRACVSGLLFSALIFILGIFFADEAVGLLTGGRLTALAGEYIKPLLIASPLFICSPILMLCVRSDADPLFAMLAVNSFAVTNLVLDILFVIVLEMGIFGASLAIIIGQGVSVGVAMLHFTRKDRVLKLSISGFSLRSAAKDWVTGISYGLTYFFQMLIILLLNNILSRWFDENHLAAYSVLFSVSMLAFILFDGVAMTISPLVATYFGEKNRESISLTMKLALCFQVISSLILFSLIVIFAGPLTAMFGVSDPNTAAYSVMSLRIYAVSVVFICINYSAISYLQSVSRERMAFVLSLLRGFALSAPIGAVLARRFGSTGIALSYVIVEGVLTVVLVLTLYIVGRREKSGILLLPEENEALPIYETVIDSGFSNLEEIVGEIGVFCENNEIDMKKSYFVNLIIEELVVKIFENGFNKNGNKKENFIVVRISKDGDDVNIHIRDDAVGYNPFNSSDDELGGIGIGMVKSKAKHFEYQRRLVFNNLYVIL